MKEKMWGGRFEGKMNKGFEYFSSSLEDDYRLAAYDIEASRVHCGMLERSRVISRNASVRIQRALGQIERSLGKSGKIFRSRLSISTRETENVIVLSAASRARPRLNLKPLT